MKQIYDLGQFLDLGISLTCLGILGIIINRKSLLISLISIEMMFYGLDLFVIVASVRLDDMAGQVLALFLLTLAASEASIALALIISYFKVNGNIIIDLATINQNDMHDDLKKRLSLRRLNRIQEMEFKHLKK